MSLLCLLIMAIILISCEGLMSKTSSSSRSITHINRWSNQISNSHSISSSSRLLAAAPDAPKGRGPPPRKAPKDDVVQVNGRVTESLPNAMFKVEIEPSKQQVLATISGKIRKNSVRIVVGDSVVCELSAYDLTRGRITYRNK
mmetsp:Transcript_9613/g.9417  ORF Transcript_9613/g.9417 Transcript_9613/m.9417 type:complete len:143 (-) Transcript_9613:169-597(-)